MSCLAGADGVIVGAATMPPARTDAKSVRGMVQIRHIAIHRNIFIQAGFGRHNSRPYVGAPVEWGGLKVQEPLPLSKLGEGKGVLTYGLFHPTGRLPRQCAHCLATTSVDFAPQILRMNGTKLQPLEKGSEDPAAKDTYQPIELDMKPFSEYPFR